MEVKKDNIGISKATIARLPAYLRYLKEKQAKGEKKASSTAIAEEMHLNAVQVRKDLALVSDGGRPKVGYNRKALIDDIEQFFGYDYTNTAVIVGSGKLGKALLDYVGFAEYGLNVAAAFDVDESIVGTLESGKPILHISQLEQFCRDNKVLIGIITVPAAHAQEVCDLLVNNGIKAIWNFAPTHIDAPADILVQYENMATSLAVLSKHLSAQINGY